MKHSTLLPLLRSQTQGELLALLFLNPEKEFSLSEVARTIGVSRPGVSHETERLVAARLIADRQDGRSRKIRADLSSPLSKPLAELLLLTYGPLPVLANELAGIEGISHAFIFGSWASRYCGKSGGSPNDIDVLIVGNADLDDLEEVAVKASVRLLKDVDFKRIQLDIWKKAHAKVPQRSPFLSTILDAPLVEIHIEDHNAFNQ